MPVTILSVEKSGSIKEHVLKTYTEEDLYKKAGFKSKDGFKLHTVWNTECNGKSYSISVYGKTTGRAGQENKYEFPPPIDNTLFFGACVLVNKNGDGEPDNLTKEEWKKVYEHLYGGFEDLDEDSISEDDVDSDVPRTKEGYVKDDFIVDDDEEDDEDFDDEEEEIIKKKKPTKKLAEKKPKKEAAEKKPKKEVAEKKPKKEIAEKKPKKEAKPKIVIDLTDDEDEANDDYLSCTKELEEEEYLHA